MSLNEIQQQRRERAEQCHQRAMRYAGMAVEAFLDYAAELRAININRYYEELGFESFSAYLRKYYDISDKQAYKYIAVYEERGRLPGELFSPGRKIEISKLYLLTTVPEEQREQLVENVDMDTVSKAELERSIAELKAENKRLEKEKQVTFEELEKLKNRPAENDMAKQRIEYLSGKLEEQKALTEKESKQRADAAQRASIAETNSKAFKSRVNQLESKIKELEAREPETITVTDTAEIDRLKAELAEAEKKLSEVSTAVPETVEVKDDIDEFRAYYATALDSVARLMSFVSSHLDSKNAELFRDKMSALANKMIVKG